MAKNWDSYLSFELPIFKMDNLGLLKYFSPVCFLNYFLQVSSVY